jgi:hypothetical protein
MSFGGPRHRQKFETVDRSGLQITCEHESTFRRPRIAIYSVCRRHLTDGLQKRLLHCRVAGDFVQPLAKSFRVAAQLGEFEV